MMKKVYLLLTLLSAKCALSQSVDWIDTLRYGNECWVSSLSINSDQEVTALGFYGEGYSAPDLSKARSFVECRTSAGQKKWLNDQISGAEAASNLAQDDFGNSYVSLWLSGLNSNVPRIEGKEYDAGTYLLKLSPEGKVNWVSQKQSPHTLPGQIRIRPNNEIVVTSVRAGGSARHVYDTAGNLVANELDAKLGYAQFDGFANAYQRYGENGQVFLIKYDAAENEQWRLPITNETRFINTGDGDIYLMIPEPFINCQLHRLDTDGKLIWTRQFKGEGCFHLWSDGANLLLGGLYRTTPDSTGQVVNKIDVNTGLTLWQRKFFIPEHSIDAITASESVVYVAINSSFEYDAMLVKITDAQWQKPDPITTSIEDKKASPSFVIYPNPTSDVFTLTPPENCESFSYRVMDATGRLVFHKQNCELPSETTERIDLSGFSKGLYTLTIELSDGSRQSKKLLVK